VAQRAVAQRAVAGGSSTPDAAVTLVIDATDTVALAIEGEVDAGHLMLEPGPLLLGIGDERDFMVGFTCTRPGQGHFSAFFQYQREGLLKSETFTRDVAKIQCGGRGDAVMLSDNTRLSRGDGGWNVLPTGVTANLVATHPDMEAGLGAISQHTVAALSVGSFDSRQGFPGYRFSRRCKTRAGATASTVGTNRWGWSDNPRSRRPTH
jgi:hypothetical protein